MFWLRVVTVTVCVPGTYRSHKRASDNVELKVWWL